MGSEHVALQSIERIYRERGQDFLRLALAQTGDLDRAREAVQEGFARAIRRRSSFRGAGSIEGWLARCVVNAAHDARRRSGRSTRADQIADHAGALDSAAESLVVREAVMQLPRRQRDALGGAAMTFASTSDVLDRLAPVYEFAADWEDVLARAGVPSGPSPSKDRRRLALVAALLAAIVVPLTAIAKSRDWWFFSAGAPAPATPVVVAKTVEWDGQRWELVAYRTMNDGLCFSMAPAGSNGRGAMNCDQIVGVTRDWKQYTPRAITYLSARRTIERPGFIVGAVTDEADEVAVYFINGDVLRTEAFAAPQSLGAIRFYAVRLPGSMVAMALGSRFVDKLAGLDREGRIVACPNLPLPPAESVPRSPCP